MKKKAGPRKHGAAIGYEERPTIPLAVTAAAYCADLVDFISRARS